MKIEWLQVSGLHSVSAVAEQTLLAFSNPSRGDLQWLDSYYSRPGGRS